MLFKTVEEIKSYLPVNVSQDMDTIAPFVNQAENKFILPAVSATQLAALQTAYDSGDMTPAQKSLMAKIRPPLANFAYLLYIPVGQVQISDAGIRIANTDQFKTAFQWQIDDLKNSFMDAGFEGLDQLLAFMETNKTDYALWTASSSYTLFKEGFLISAEEFTKYFNINNSRMTFQALKPIMRRIEDFKIKPVTCSTLFTEIKTAISTGGTISAPIRALLNFIQPAVAHLTIAAAISEMAVKINNNGLQVFGGSITNQVNVPEPAPGNHLSNIQQQAEVNGQNYLKQLKDYLDDNVATYTTYASSSCYTDPTTITDTSSDTHPGLFNA